MKRRDARKRQHRKQAEAEARRVEHQTIRLGHLVLDDARREARIEQALAQPPAPPSRDRRGRAVAVGGFTLADIARAIGASQSYISRLSRRHSLPSMATGAALRDLFGAASIEDALAMLTRDHDEQQARSLRLPSQGGQ